jgi:phage terminase small subunit
VKGKGGRKRGMTPKQAAFVEQYLLDMNATQAAIRAGYSKKTADVIAGELLRKTWVAEAVEKAKAKRSAKVGITQERVLRELELLAFSDVTHYVVDEHGNVKLAEGAPEGALRALSSIKHKVRTIGGGENAVVEHDVEVKLWNKPDPLKLAGRHVGAPGFFDRMELTGPNGSPAEVTFRIESNADSDDDA